MADEEVADDHNGHRHESVPGGEEHGGEEEGRAGRHPPHQEPRGLVEDILGHRDNVDRTIRHN